MKKQNLFFIALAAIASLPAYADINPANARRFESVARARDQLPGPILDVANALLRAAELYYRGRCHLQPTTNLCHRSPTSEGIGRTK